jgi:hypothetical protein
MEKAPINYSTMLKVSRHGQRINLNTISIRIWNISINPINYKII